MASALEILEFQELPSPEHFVLQIESRSVPSVFRGCVKNWKAFSSWNPEGGGLDYLEAKVGCSVVEAMMSRSAPIFHGDLGSHERVPLQFSSFISSCKQHYSQMQRNGDGIYEEDESGTVRDDFQFYLAQVPLLNTGNKEKSQLESLEEDILMPTCLAGKTLASINLWMNCSRCRSSTHYDPHNNLLSVVAGSKKVVLWPPSSSPMLYPRPIYGEASNHSTIDLENPDFNTYERARFYMDFSQEVLLHAGDALFIPEGWFHQVDSVDLTIAVNFWWQSNVMINLLEHMDAYYLRRIIRRLIDKEVDEMLNCSSSYKKDEEWILKHPKGEKSSDEEPEGKENAPEESKSVIGFCGRMSHDRVLIETNCTAEMSLHQLCPLALHALYELISLVHENISAGSHSSQKQLSLKDSENNLEDDSKNAETVYSFSLKSDPIAKIILHLEPFKLRAVLLAMAHKFPKTLETLVLFLLSPLGAEVLTRKFDEMDKKTTEEEQKEFYQTFYSVFDDQYSAMDAILNGKESFSFQAFRNVLDQYLGVTVRKPNSSTAKP